VRLNEEKNAACDARRAPAEAWDALCSGGVLADLVTDRVFVIDEQLRILHANKAFLAAFGGLSLESVVGRTLGEITDCRHAEGGRRCGGTAACKNCGWFQAVETSGQEGAGDQECRILMRNGGALDFAVAVRRSGVGVFRLCCLKDLFAQKRLRVLERSFFHDVTNLAAGIRGLCELAEDPNSGQGAELYPLIFDSARKMVDEIERLRTLRVAENGDLRLFRTQVSPVAVLRAVVERFSEDAAARRVEAVIDERAAPDVFETDKDVLTLILGELSRNAIEASSRGNRVTLACVVEGGQVLFTVHNEAVLDESVRAHVFERSFTTRGSGRGVGAYRAKLLAERYLKGAVEFVSQAPQGTTFIVRLPLTSAHLSV
jgi:anti-sigma regulatory factor (Ser/Thr protein kinase)